MPLERRTFIGSGRADRMTGSRQVHRRKMVQGMKSAGNSSRQVSLSGQFIHVRRGTQPALHNRHLYRKRKTTVGMPGMTGA